MTYSDKFKRLNLRQRVIVTVCLVSLVYLLWSLMIGYKIQVDKDSLAKENKRMVGEIEQKQERLELINAGYNAVDIDSLKEQLKQLESSVYKLDSELKYLSGATISADDLASILKQMLAKQKNISLDFLAILPREEIKLEEMVENSGASEGADKEKVSAVLYKHGVDIGFTGKYTDVVQYLKEIESLQWRFFWKEFHYEVNNYPDAKVVLSIYTLSLDEGVFGV